MEGKRWRSCKVMVCRSQLKNFQYWLLPQKMKMLKTKSLSSTKFRGEKHIHTVSLVNLKQYYTNSKPSKYFQSTPFKWPTLLQLLFIFIFFPNRYRIWSKNDSTIVQMKKKKSLLSPSGSAGRHLLHGDTFLWQILL